MNKLILLLSCILSLPLSAQNRQEMPNPLDSLTKKQSQLLEQQALSLFKAAQPSVQKSAQSTAVISYRNFRLSYGTVVYSPALKKNVILTKWSEIFRHHNQLSVRLPNGKYNRGVLLGIYPDYDLAVLDANLKLTPLDLKSNSSPDLGEMITLASPDGSVLSLGVVSVKARSLRDTDKAFLGVRMDFKKANKKGTPIIEIVENSPAEKSGLRRLDIITHINQQRIQGAMEMRNTLQKLIPNTEISVGFQRGDKNLTVQVKLAGRPREIDPRRFSPHRMKVMQRMGAIPSKISTNFPNAIQSDMPIQSDNTPETQRDNFTNECGGPITDLDGKPVGILIARGSRIKSFIIPAETIQTLLKAPPVSL